ncbi:MAG: exodeoxyribonuclease VII small subunit [Lachnospiraceae bacterium]|nr:exodeoxyribonuclease VII small subunit [Lachnospiraceae bacterium]
MAGFMPRLQTRRQTMSLEENFAKLEETIKKLEQEDISLEDSFAAYTEGMELLKLCNEEISKVEKKVQVISEDGTLEEF